MRQMTPFAVWSNTVQLGFLIAEAQAVIAMRLMGMAGMWSVTPSEDGRMVTEKLEALTQAGLAAQRAALTGKSPAAVTAAAIAPIRRKTRANARRLGKRGPKRS